MGKRDYYKKGDWNVTCDRTGFKRKASECSFDHGRRGMGNTVFVTNKDIDKPQMQDYVKGVSDDQRVPIARPDNPPQFVTGVVNPYDF